MESNMMQDKDNKVFRTSIARSTSLRFPKTPTYSEMTGSTRVVA